MRTGKRITALLLAMLLVVGLLAGCGSGATQTSEAPAESQEASTAPAESEAPAQTPDAAESAPAEEAAPPAEEEAPAEEAAPAEDVDPTDWDEPVMDLPLAGTPATLSLWCQKPGGAVSTVAPNGYYDYPHWQQAAELTGVSLEFIQAEFMVASEQFGLMIASNDYPDMIGGFNSLYAAGDDYGIDQEIIIALEDYADLFPHYEHYRTSSRFLESATTTQEGHIAGFYELMSDFIGPFFGMMARGDWMEDLGIESPTTYDELHDMMVAFMNEKGASYGIYLDSAAVGNDNFLAAGYGVPVMLATNAKESYWYVQDGVVKDGITGEGYQDYLRMLHQWYTEGLISTDFTSAQGAMSNDGMSAITTGKVGVFFNGAPMMSMYSVMSDDPNLRLVGVADPTIEKGDITHLDTTEYDFGAERFSITTQCENPELAIQYADFWFTERGIRLANYGADGVSCEVVDGQPQFTDAVLNNPDLAAGDAISFYTGRNSTPSWSSNSKLLVSFNEDEAGAFAIWEASRDNRDVYPYVASLTIEESEDLSALASDYETYALEARDRFIVGDMDIETEYEAYEQALHEMGLTRALEIKQAAYDRYMEK
jgi:putative aldouronate transport system substrate-binding protein